MAQTDARAGFRLPWNSERSNSEQTETDVQQAEAHQVETEQTDAPAAQAEWGTAESGTSTDPETPTGDAEYEATTAVIDNPTETADSHEAASSPMAPRKQSKFMADLTKAMQTAAEDARTRTLTQFQAEAKAYVEQIHARSATEATEIRRKADDDVAAVREWSKAEIARIREETETQITARKSRLEGEIDGHAGMIEREIEQVTARVASFEEEMAAFFTRLLAEENPNQFALMAERLPEPPPFEEMSSGNFVVAEPAEGAEAEAVEAVELIGDTEATDETATDSDTAVEGEVETVEGEASTETVEGEAEAAAETDTETESGPTFEGEITVPDDFELDRESAFAAIQAAAEAAASAEVATDAADRAEAVADIAIEIVGNREDESDDPDDLRVAALGMTPDYDAAEAEAAQAADSNNESEEIPEIGDDALAARLAGLVPGKGSDKGRSTETKSTQVVVVGLVSVASIASFKRHLGRLAGVQSVGVSSGPDGEFLFAVHHSADVVLRDAIPSMPSFQARVTGSGDGTLNVSAHDPESDN
jgi:hypothetical protein